MLVARISAFSGGIRIPFSPSRMARGMAPTVGGDPGEAGGHAFEDGHGEALLAGGGDQEVAGGVDGGHVGALAEEVDDVAEGEVGEEALDFGAVGAFADQEVPGGWEVGAEAGDGAEEEVGALVVGEAAYPADEEAIGRYGEVAEGGSGVGEGAEVDAVAEEVDVVGRDAGVEEALADVVGDGDDGAVVAEDATVDDAVEPDEAVVVVPGVAGGDEGHR